VYAQDPWLRRFLLAVLSCAIGVGLAATFEYRIPAYPIVSQTVAIATAIGSLVTVGLMIPLLKLPSPGGLFLTGAGTALMPVIVNMLLKLSSQRPNAHGFAAWAFIMHVGSCELSTICLWTMAGIHAVGRRQE